MRGFYQFGSSLLLQLPDCKVYQLNIKLKSLLNPHNINFIKKIINSQLSHIFHIFVSCSIQFATQGLITDRFEKSLYGFLKFFEKKREKNTNMCFLGKALKEENITNMNQYQRQ